MSFVRTLPPSPSFESEGLKGYQFPHLRNQDLEIYLLDVWAGHDYFIISKQLTRVYYILEGSGHFTIDNTKYPVRPGMLVEVPPNIEYSYSGAMKIILISHPRWFNGNEIKTKKNPDVIRPLRRRVFPRLGG